MRRKKKTDHQVLPLVLCLSLWFPKFACFRDESKRVFGDATGITIGKMDAGAELMWTGRWMRNLGRRKPAAEDWSRLLRIRGRYWEHLLRWRRIHKQSRRASRLSSFPSDRLSLSCPWTDATGSSVDHMTCFGDAAGRLQETALDASTKGNRYINSCLRLNEEIKGVDTLAARLRNMDVLDTAVNKLLRPP
ncbi:unnamed protein product [Brassica oleracea var. botrytis]